MSTTSSGMGRLRPPHLAVLPWTQMIAGGDGLAADVYFGGTPPAPVQIPYTWLRPPLRVRQDNPFTVAEVAVTDAERAVAADPAAGRQWRYAAILDTVAGADAGYLAQWIIDFYDTSRPRIRDLTLRLNERSQTELWTILDVELGTRIQITGLPVGYPTGAGELVVEGVRHRMDAAVRDVIWSTSPVIGAAVGQSGPWFRLGESAIDGTDTLPA